MLLVGLVAHALSPVLPLNTDPIASSVARAITLTTLTRTSLATA